MTPETRKALNDQYWHDVEFDEQILADEMDALLSPETRGESCEENLFLDGYEVASGEVLEAAREIVAVMLARLDSDIPF